MRSQLFSLVVAVQLFLVSAQVLFSQPAEGEVISGDVPFIFNVTESTSAPYFSQMTNFSLYLLAGSYSSPIPIFAWNLPDVNPSTVANNVNIPSDVGTNAKDAYFLGIRGTIILAPTLSVTYFSPLFTLQNMTGPSSLIPVVATRTLTAATGTVTGLITSTPTSKPFARAIDCLDPNTGIEIVVSIGEISADSPCLQSAISMLNLLSTQTRTATQISATGMATSLPTAIGMSKADNTSINSSSQTSAGALAGSDTPSSGFSGRVVYIAVIATLALLAPIILLWLALHYRASQVLQPPPPSLFSCFRPFFSSLKGFAVLSEGKDTQSKTQPRQKRKHSDAEKGQGLEVHVTRSLHHMSTRQSQPNPTAMTANSTMVQRRAFEEMYTKREGRKTILAELEGDPVVFQIPETPVAATVPAPPQSRPRYARVSVPSEIQRWRTSLDQAYDTYEAKRRSEAMSAIRDAEDRNETERSSVRDSIATRGTAVLSEGRQARVVKGKEVANIVTFTRKAVPPPPPHPPVPALSILQRQKALSRASLQERELPSIPHVAHLSTLSTSDPYRTGPTPIPTSRFSVRSVSLPSSTIPNPNWAFTQSLSTTTATTSQATKANVKAKARITQLEDEVFTREASVVVRGIEEEKKMRQVRKERRERKRGELLRGGIGGSATIDMEVVRWVSRSKKDDDEDDDDVVYVERNGRRRQEGENYEDDDEREEEEKGEGEYRWFSPAVRSPYR